MTQQITFKEIQEQHENLLSQVSGIGDVKQVQEFLNILAERGTYTKDANQRSQLRTFIRYWSSFINDKTGNFPIVELQPFNELQRRTAWLNRKVAIILSTSAIVIILIIIIIITRIINSTSLPSPINIGAKIPQNGTLNTTSNYWFVIIGDVSYYNLNSKPISIKTENGYKPDDITVGSLVAVRGTGMIKAPFGAYYIPYSSTVTIDDIKRILMSMKKEPSCTGTCLNVSIVIIDNSRVIYKTRIAA